MYKIYILLFSSFLILLPANASELENIINKVYEKSSKSTESYLENLFSGPGDTEVSIMGKNGNKPEGSIMIVRPLKIQDDNILFYQGQISNYSVIGKERQGLNLGLGYRNLSNDGNSFYGVNSFIDSDSEENLRASLGLELRSSNFELNGNYYEALSGGVKVGLDTNRALSGHNISVVGQMPYVPWANLSVSSYEWDAAKNSKNSKGEVYKAELNLTNSISLEAGVDDNNISLEDNFARLTYTYPGRERTTMLNGFVSTDAFENSDVREDMLSKVKRSNQITVEVESSGVIISNGNS